jgi:hypothetical protein
MISHAFIALYIEKRESERTRISLALKLTRK